MSLSGSADLVAFFLLFVVLINLLFNQVAVPRLKAVKPAQKSPFVSILVPARNEAGTIGLCLSSLLAQDYSDFEILLLDDHSKDATAQIARHLGFSDQVGLRTRIVEGADLPDGWIGKAWACQQLATFASGEYLLFTDADTIHAPGALSAAMHQALRRRSDLLTLWPNQITGTLAEKLVVPFLFVAVAGFLPHWFLNQCQDSPMIARWFGPKWMRALGAANGQFLLFRAASYWEIGGHFAVADHLVEDVAFGRMIAERIERGARLTHCDGTKVVRCRMYHSFGEVWEGFTKNLRPVFEGSDWQFCAMLAVQSLAFFYPGAILLFHRSALAWINLALLLLIRLICTVRYRTSILGLLLHPFGFALALAIASNSLRKASGQGLTWKGRLYRTKY